LEGHKRFDWERFDLRDKKIYLTRKKFFLGLEWIDKRATRQKMLSGLQDWEAWKIRQYHQGNQKVEKMSIDQKDGSKWTYYKYHGNMMQWPGWDSLPPFTGIMVETGKNENTSALRTFERKTSFSPWAEKAVTLNAVLTISH
jgi:hypothetical protein